MVIPNDPYRFAKAEKLVEAQLSLLEKAVSQIGASIVFASVTGRPIHRLARELDITIRTTPGFGSLPRWRPKLDISSVPNSLRFELVIPEDRLDRHGPVMTLSYLLRAHMDSCLQTILPSNDERNIYARKFADFAMFGRPPKFSSAVEARGSLHRVHADRVPMTLVLGYMARHQTAIDGVVETFKTFTPYHPDVNGDIKPAELEPIRKIGTGPSGIEFVKLLRRQGAMCKYGIRRDHIIKPDLCDRSRALVAVTRQVDDVMDEDGMTPKIAVSRTVVWTGTREAFRYYFSEGHDRLQ